MGGTTEARAAARSVSAPAPSPLLPSLGPRGRGRLGAAAALFPPTLRGARSTFT